MTITGPSSGLVGATLHYTANPTCSPGTPEVQWYRRIGTGSFAIVRPYHTTPTLDYPTVVAGTHQFVARVRAVGTTRTTLSNTLTVAVTNVAPITVDDALTAAEDTPGTVNVLANDSDPNGDPLTATLTSGPTSGTATIAAGVISYTPAANFHGSDAIAYLANDGQGNTTPGTLAITVTPVNDPPVAVDNFSMVTEDFPATINVVANDTDADGDTLSITSVTQPAQGAVTILDTRRVSYQPALDYNGADSFTYTISDGLGGTATATVSVIVTSVDDPPVAAGDAASVAEDSSVTFDVVANDSDIDEGDELTLFSVTTPAHGTASITSEHRVTYTPAANYGGGDTFSYTVRDGSGASDTATVTINVTPVNDVPLANADTGTLDEDASATIDVVANDFDLDGDPLTITAVTQPAHGLASIADGHRVTYTPAPNYHGGDTLTY
ncbi:MAG: tandem-95 repeat protein, partial [Myxococcales bacterium]|nr:tandem-95 repeat protein [Myxococcales bacterium]